MAIDRSVYYTSYHALGTHVMFSNSQLTSFQASRFRWDYPNFASKSQIPIHVWSDLENPIPVLKIWCLEQWVKKIISVNWLNITYESEHFFRIICLSRPFPR